MITTLTIRSATTEDVASLVALLNQAMAYKVAHDDYDWHGDPFANEEVAELQTNGTLYIAYAGLSVVGMFQLRWGDVRTWGERPKDAGYLHRLAVSQDYHGQGIGGQLLDFAVAEVAKHGRQFLRLDCSINNQGLCKFYEAHGFKQVGQKIIPAFTNYTAALYERALEK